MEQSVRKKQLAILACGGLLALALAAAHYRSPLAGRLSAGRDVEVVLLTGNRPMLFVYHPLSRTVDSIRLARGIPSGTRRGVSACQRAWESLRLFRRNESGAQDAPVYVEIRDPDIDSFEDVLNGWRSRPARLVLLFRYLYDLYRREATSLSPYELLLAALELVRLDSSDFVKEVYDAGSGSGGARKKRFTQAPAPAVVRLQVLNASGRRKLAARVTKFLRQKGFDVISLGNHSSFERHTKIVNCSDNIGAAREAREALGLDGLEIYSKFNRLAVADVRVILGEDFKEDVLNRGMR